MSERALLGEGGGVGGGNRGSWRKKRSGRALWWVTSAFSAAICTAACVYKWTGLVKRSSLVALYATVVTLLFSRFAG